MIPAFFILAAVAVISTALVITRLNAVHALLYLIVSLLSAAMIFYILGAPFAAALEVIIYAGAIIVLFIFVVMMLNLGPESVEQERRWLGIRAWGVPAVLIAVLAGELVYILARGGGAEAGAVKVLAAKDVGMALYGPYLLGVEFASMLLLAGLVGAYHIGRRTRG
jgi:NADH-quinone oxidoreductase subunit J